MQALKDSLLEIKQNLSPKNLSKFENDVEVHMQHIQTGNFNVISYIFWKKTFNILIIREI